MMLKWLPLFVFALVFAKFRAQHASNSLQGAVDALHRREAQLALRNNLNFPSRYSAIEDEYWNDSIPGHLNRQRLNKLLAKYLARDVEEEPEYRNYLNDEMNDNNIIIDENKRSFFRERDGKFEQLNPTILRDQQILSYGQPELTDEFLKEVEHERDLNREEKYKETLRRLWQKYQEQENEIEDELFDDEKKQNFIPINDEFHHGQSEKRSYPILPWLPVQAKRFPVAKRSPLPKQKNINNKGTDEKVIKDLQSLFKQHDYKKKRSIDTETMKQVPSTQSTTASNENLSKKGQEENIHNPIQIKNDLHKEYLRESEENSTEHDYKHKEGHENEEKETPPVQKLTKLNSIKDLHLDNPKINNRQKKSIQWSKYFGIDRRKKSEDWYMKSNPATTHPPTTNLNDQKQKEQIDYEKLNIMDSKLKTIEDLIIEETLKYTGAHEGIFDPDEIQRLKDHVVGRLATAYNVEKMRRALSKFRDSIKDENKSKESLTPKIEAEKRVAVKKEMAIPDPNENSINSSDDTKPKDSRNEVDNDAIDNNKKKRNNLQRYSDSDNDITDDEIAEMQLEPIIERYYAGGIHGQGLSKCPLLDKMIERCRSVDLLSGDINQALLPICGIHQLCYLCGTSQTACDYQYLSEADSICERNVDCHSVARSALMILRGTPGPQFGPKECLQNPCLYRAMREIGL